MNDPPPDAAEFNDFMERREGQVRARLAAFAEGPDHLDDLLQDTWLRCLQRWHQLRGDNRTGWVLAIARSVGLDDYRARQRRRRSMDTAVPEAPARTPAFELDEIRRRVTSSLQELTQREQEVVRLRLLGDAPTSIVATTLGISESTVRVHLANGIRKLREQLKEEGR